MVWIYLSLLAVGLGIIAWCFKAEDKDGYAASFFMSGGICLFLAVLASPLLIKLLMVPLIVLFRSRINLAFLGSQEDILNCVRMYLHPMAISIGPVFAPVSKLISEPLIPSLGHLIRRRRREQRTVNTQSTNSKIIDIKAIPIK